MVALLMVVVLTGGGGLAVRAYRRAGRSSRRWPGSTRARCFRRIYPLLAAAGCSPSFSTVAWAAVDAVLACSMVAPTGRTRLPGTFEVRLATEDAARLGAYLGPFADDVAELVQAVASQRGWLCDRPVSLTVVVDPSVSPLNPTVSPRMRRTIGPPKTEIYPRTDGGTIARVSSEIPPRLEVTSAPATSALRTVVIDHPFLMDMANGQHFELFEGETIVGRGRGAHLRLDGDELVSRRHVAVVAEGEVVTVADIGSANRPRLNGRPLLARSLLRSGDVLEVGATRLQFRRPTGAASHHS